MIDNFVQWLITSLIDLVISLVNIIVGFLDDIILKVLLSIFPDFSMFFVSIAKLLDVISGGLGFAISSLGLAPETLSVIVLYYTFKLTAPLLFSSIKSAIKWFKTLKL